MNLVRDWIFGFLKRYKALIGPGDWPTGEDRAEMELFVMAWVTQLGKMSPKPSEEEADLAIQRLILAPPQWRRECIPAVVDAIKEMRREKAEAGAVADARTPAELGAIERSKGCPECHATGWASRPAYWHSIPRPILVQLFCRCPAGRFQKAHDPELFKGDLSHPTWSDRPCGHDMVIDPECAGLWWYAAIGEAAPEPIVPAELAGRVFSLSPR